MMGRQSDVQSALFYELNLDNHVPPQRLLRSIDRFVYLAEIRCYLAPFYSVIGQPSIDPELMIRMLLVVYDRVCPCDLRPSGPVAGAGSSTWSIS